MRLRRNLLAATMASDAGSGFERTHVDAALDLAPPAPTAGPLVLAGLDWARARQAADGWKALGYQRMSGQSGVRDIFEHVARVPADQRIDLDPLALRFEQWQGRARR